MIMDDFYKQVQKELVGKRDAVAKVLKQSKLVGDYSESIFREFLANYVPKGFEVSKGIVLFAGNPSNECDIIIYDAAMYVPLFKSGELVLMENEGVRAVIEVKSEINTEQLKKALQHLEKIKKLDKELPCYLVGFNTGLSISTIRKRASKIDGAFVLSKRCKRKGVRKNEITGELEGELLRFYTGLKKKAFNT